MKMKREEERVRLAKEKVTLTMALAGVGERGVLKSEEILSGSIHDCFCTPKKPPKADKDAAVLKLREQDAEKKAEMERLAKKAEDEKIRLAKEAEKKAEAELQAKKAEDEKIRLAKEAEKKAEMERQAKKAEDEKIRLAKEAQAKAEAERQAKKAEDEKVRLAKEAKEKAESERLAKKAENEKIRLAKEAEDKAEAERQAVNFYIRQREIGAKISVSVSISRFLRLENLLYPTYCIPYYDCMCIYLRNRGIIRRNESDRPDPETAR